jgi:two-component system NtrC family sensor kinase
VNVASLFRLPQGSRWPLAIIVSCLIAGGFVSVLLWPGRPWPVVLLAAGLLVVLAWLALARQRLAVLEQERAALARQVDRRINEIFSLQELSYVLAESLQSDRIAMQVSRYVMRFLNAEGAAVSLMSEDGSSLLVAAAEGSLAAAEGKTITSDQPSLTVRAVASERIEVDNGGDDAMPLLPGQVSGSGAAAPMRAHGLTMGVLTVAARRPGSFTAEDLWLLSTVATHVAVVLANSRLFEMVRQAKEAWETAFNALSEGIAVLDGSGRISRGNGALARQLGLAGPTLIGQPFWPTVVGEAEGEDEMLGAARRGERPPSLTVRSTVLRRILRLTAAPLGEVAEHASVVVLVEDVTEQRSLETQLIQSEKLAAVGQLVSGVAHELNNPLTSIAGLSEFLQERPGIPAAERDHLRVIHEQADRAGRIVRNLLTFARKGSPGSAPIDLNDILEHTALLVAYELRLRGITLTQERAGPLPIRGNRDELQQVLLNLVTNAAHAVRDLPEHQPRVVTVTLGRSEGRATIRVRDTGPGVPTAMVPQLFTPFFTTKDPGQGTGLGLSLSYRIVEAHGGVLAYQPAPDGGAEFGFSLPLVDPRVSRRLTPMPNTAERAALVVDSDPSSQLVVRALCEPAGYQVEVARTAAEANERLASRPWVAVILDASISVDGKELLVDQLAEELEPDALPRLLISTSDQALASRFRGTHIVVMPRPFLPRDLLVAMGELLETVPRA